VGNDGRGLIYGTGKFLRDARYAGGGRFAPGQWRGTSVPAKPVRGMYINEGKALRVGALPT
jgi:hypothetical protein